MEVRELEGTPAGRVGGERLVHEPALDGLRGLAVAAVVVFHLGHLRGGFLGVDLFFVLSGFLITSLLLNEHRRRGGIDLPHFWSRRARRLLPALFLLLAGVGLLLVLFATGGERARARGDALSTVGYVANWHRVFSDLGYWDIFGNPSPLDHMWSLAIEEQFYVLWPVLVLLVLRRHGTRALGWVVAAGAAASFGVLAFYYAPGDTNRAYYGTDSRIGPTLLGAGLALVVAGRARRAAPPRAAADLAAVAALAVMAASAVAVDGQASWYYRGGLVVFAAATTLVIAVVTGGPPGSVAKALSVRPLAALGVISYGVYLWHWPVIVYLGPERVGVDGWQLAAVQIGATLALSIASFVLVERPIRRGALRAPQVRIATAGAVAVVLAVVLAATSGRSETAVAGGIVPVQGADDPALLYPADIPPDAPRLLLVGDSGVYALGPAFREAAAREGVSVATSAQMICTVVVPEDAIRSAHGEVDPWPPCHDVRRDLWTELVDDFAPDVVVYYLANAGSLGDVRLDGAWVGDCDPAYRAYLREALREDAALLQRGGARLVITTSPAPVLVDPERLQCRNDTYREIAASIGADVVDLGRFVAGRQREGVEMLKDLVHLSDRGARLASDWLLAELGPRLADRR
jgi:peptidoglycan/LPS O-acetylase OafA/YrhL